MASPSKIAISVACIALTLPGLSLVWWMHRGKVVDWKRLSDLASECRVRAERGDVKAEEKLASLYYHGRGVPQDYTEAIRWYRRAAEQGDAAGQLNLGLMYYHGTGVPQDYGEAVRWYRKAAEQGDLRAQRSLESLANWSRPSIQSVELPTALLALSGGLWFLWSSSRIPVRGNRLADWRRIAATLLGLDLLANSGLSFYAFAVDIRFSPYRIAFYVSRVLLVLAMIVWYVLTKREKTSQLAGTA